MPSGLLGDKVHAAGGHVGGGHDDADFLAHHQHPAGAQIPVGHFSVVLELAVFKFVEADKALRRCSPA